MNPYRTWTILPFDLQSESKLGRNGGPGPQSAPKAGSATRPIPVRVWENVSSWFVEADIPGVVAAAVFVEFYKDRLTIRYERSAPDAGANEFDDRGYGVYERSVRIADEIRSDAIVAKLENGVLRLELPKSDTGRPKTIVVSGQ